MSYGWEKFLTNIGNYGKAVADTTLSTVGAPNVIKDDMYKGPNKGFFQDASAITGQIAATIAPMALNTVAPGAGTALQVVQQGVGTATQMPYGGMNMKPNVELEKEEVLKTPNGQVRQVDGPPHSKGGVDINLPPATKVFSDRLKTKNNKTFAEEAEKWNTAKWEKILKDVNADEFAKTTAKRMIETANKKLDLLFAQQEAMKTNDLVKKTGLDKQVMAYGGKVKMPDGGEVPPISKEALILNQFALDLADPYIDPMLPNTNIFPKQPGVNFNPTPIINSTIPQLKNNSLNPATRLNLDGSPIDNNQIAPQQNILKSNLPPTYIDPNSIKSLDVPENTDKTFNNPLSGVDPYFTLGTAGNFLGSVYDIYRGIKGGDEVNFERIDPDLVDYSKSRQMGVQETNRGFNATAKAIQQATGGNAGAYLSNVGNAGYLRDEGNRRMISQSYENERNTNAQIKNQAKSQNAQIQMQESIARQQEKDIASNTLAKGLYNFGSALNTYGTDMQLKGNEPILKALIATGDYDYQYDSKGKPIGITYKGTNKTTYYSGLTKAQKAEMERIEAEKKKLEKELNGK